MSFKSSGYKSVKRGFTLDWATDSPKEPVLDREFVTYGWIVKGSREMGLTSIMSTNESGEKVIDQAALSSVREEAVGKLIAFYQKLDTELNREIVRSNAIVKDIHIPSRPNSKVLFYVTVDARAFDNVPNKGSYTLQAVGKDATLHTLAEEYRGFFEINAPTEAGHRARLAEILKANNIDIDIADEKMIKEWIAAKNQDPTKDVKFKEGVQIYLPIVAMPEPPTPAHTISLMIGDIESTINQANINLEFYKEKIKTFHGKVENLKLQTQIDLLKKFYDSLRKHLSFNDVEIKNVLADDVDIFLNEDYEVIYLAIDRSGEKIPLLKGMPSLSSYSPFDDLRTMALMSSITEISEIDINEIEWKEFVEKYIFPPVTIRNLDPNNLFDQYQADTRSVVDQIGDRFNKSSFKTPKEVADENATLADPKVMGAAVKQETALAKKDLSSTDSFVSNLPTTSDNMRVAASAGGQAAIDAAYSEVLNKISVEELIKLAVQCLSKILDCSEIVDGVLGKNLLLGYGTFKKKLPIDAQHLADRALQVAQTDNFDLFNGAYAAANLPKHNTSGLKFTAVLRLAMEKESSIQYDVILEEVCADLLSLVSNPQGLFNIPLMLFPDNLPTVDLQGTIGKMLQNAIINLLVGLVVELVNMLLKIIVDACSDLNAAPPEADFGAANLVDAIADKVGGPDLAQILADLFDSLGGNPNEGLGQGALGPGGTLTGETAPPLSDAAGTTQDTGPLGTSLGTCTFPDGHQEALTQRACELAGGVWSPDLLGSGASGYMDLSSQGTLSKQDLADIARKCSLIKRLLSDLSVILTPAEIASLFNGMGGDSVLGTILDVIKERHMELYEKVDTKEKVADLFIKLERIVNVGAILSEINTISRGLGCTFESKCIRDDLRRRNINDLFGDLPGAIPAGDDIFDDFGDPAKSAKDKIGELIGGGPFVDLKMPDTLCQDKGSSIDKGLVPRTNSSLMFILKKVVNVLYDGIYMAFDANALLIPEGLSIMRERPKVIPRTTLQGTSIGFDTFNFYKMQEEKFTLDFPDWLPKKTVINPEFQRLVAQGYVPPDGDPQGQFGPYTTEKLKLVGILPTPFNSAPLDDVRIAEKYFIFAGDSQYGLKKINKIKMGKDTDATGLNRMFFALTEPFKEGGQFKPSTFAIKLSFNAAKNNNDYKNTFMLQIGDIPVDPSTIPVGQNLTPGEVTPSISFGPLESAIYRSRLGGVVSVDAEAERVIGVLQEKTGNNLIKIGGIPQIDVLYGFIEMVVDNGGTGAPGPPVIEVSEATAERGSRSSGGTPPATNLITAAAIRQASNEDLKDFVYQKMYNDLMLQIVKGLGSESVASPLFKKTKEDGTRFIKLIDWAPIPTDAEKECDFDPHILALDTVKRRTREAYEQYIKCSPMEDEISVDGLGRPNMSALEVAGMTGCVMTTLRAYGLEQLIRSMFPVSVFSGEEFITKLMVEYIIEETLRGIKRISPGYYDAFLDQVMFIFGLRMKENNPFGSIPEILAQSKEMGINWMYAQAAVDEHNGKPTGEEVQMEEFDSVHAGVNAHCDADDVASGVETKTSIRSSKEQMVRSRIRFLAEEQLYSVLPKLQDLICLNGTFTFDDNFLNKRLPLFDVQKEKGEVRFSKMFETLRTMEQEELVRTYGEYLKSFEEWESTRLGNLIGSGFAAIADIADTIGTSMTCLGDAMVLDLDLDIPEVPEDAGILDGGLDAIWDTVTALPGAVGSIPGAVMGAFDDMGGCLDMAVAGGKLNEDIPLVGGHETSGVVGALENALNVITDSPPTLESFGNGLEKGTIDKIGNLDEFVRDGEKGKFPISDEYGGVVLEKYIKVKKKGYVPSLTMTGISIPTFSRQNPSIDIPGNIGENHGPYIPPQLSTSPVASFGATTADGLSIAQILCPRELHNTSNRFEAFATNPVDATPEEEVLVSDTTNASVIPEINTETEQIYNIEEWGEIFNEIKSAQPNTKFKDLYESWSFGVRMVYVAPTNDFEEVPDNTEPGVASQTLKIPTIAGASSNPVRFVFDEEIVDSSRSFRLFERIEVEKKSQALDYQFPAAAADEINHHGDAVISGPERHDLDAAMDKFKTYSNTGAGTEAGESAASIGQVFGDDGFQMTPFPERDSPLTSVFMNDQLDSAITKVQMERAITIFPLSEVEIPINIDKDKKLSQILSSINIGRNKPNKDFNEFFRRRFMWKLMTQLKDSPGYRLIFKYCAPSHTFLSFSAIYANLLNEMTDDHFDNTKYELKKLFEILLNGGDYTFETDEEKKRGGNREAYAFAKANAGTDGGARNPGMLGMAVNASKMAFKGLTEFIDPVIAPAALIVKAGKAGKLLPKFIKKLDKEGIETADNYLMEATVGPYDLPPPMGKFSIPLPEFLQPDDYVEPFDGLSNNPSENITFEMPVFELKDTITGESLAPFFREKIFKLKSGNASDRELFYELSLAIAQFNAPTMIQLVMKVYLAGMQDPSCPEWLIKVNGNPVIPIPNVIFPGDKLDLPITPVAMASLPMDMLMGYGPGPPHSPLGYIYHAVVAAEGLGMPDMETKARLRKKAGMENKKKPKEKLCIDIDLLRDEEDKRRG